LCFVSPIDGIVLIGVGLQLSWYLRWCFNSCGHLFCVHPLRLLIRLGYIETNAAH
jgi:hypothetical protein